MGSALHPDLLEVREKVYLPCEMILSQCVPEVESKEYGAFDFEMNNRRIKFRVAKSTLIKIGQFVTLWKRIGAGPIMPYDVSDPVDLFVISVRRGERIGQFVFPKSVLCENDVLSKEGKGGKRAMRVYPPWDVTKNQQARKTQRWQLEYFFEIDFSIPLDIARIQQLFL